MPQETVNLPPPGSGGSDSHYEAHRKHKANIADHETRLAVAEGKLGGVSTTVGDAIAAAQVSALPQFEQSSSGTLALTRAAHQGATIILSASGATISFSATTQGNGFTFTLKNRTGSAWTVPTFTGATREYARAAAHTTVVSGGDVTFEVYTRNSTMYVSILGDTA